MSGCASSHEGLSQPIVLGLGLQPLVTEGLAQPTTYSYGTGLLAQPITSSHGWTFTAYRLQSGISIDYSF